MALKKVNLNQQAIPLKELLNILREEEHVRLEGKTKIIDISADRIVVIDQQQLLEQLPSTIGELSIGAFEKRLLLQGERVVIGTARLQVSDDGTQLRIEHPDGQGQLKRGL